MPEPFEASPLAAQVARDQHDRDRDLGFGSIVSDRSRQRLLNRDGTFNVVRVGLGALETLAPYHALLTMTWPSFIGVVGLLYVTLNLVFATAFFSAGPDAVGGPGVDMLGGAFTRDFFFSVQTFATIGYGQIGPNGLLSNLIVTVEALVGLMYQALATGLLFARFARPTAAILFSDRAVIAPYAGRRALEFRIANRRRNQIVQLEAQVLFSYLQDDGAGRRVRRYDLLPLERNKVTFFPLSWTIVHPIDETSPLATRTADDLLREQAEILVLLSGLDETFAQTVHARTSYRADEIVWNARFTSMFVEADGHTLIGVDVGRIHDIEALT